MPYSKRMGCVAKQNRLESRDGIWLQPVGLPNVLRLRPVEESVQAGKRGQENYEDYQPVIGRHDRTEEGLTEY